MNIEGIVENMTLQEKADLCSGRDFWNLAGVERLGVLSIAVCDGPNGLRKQEPDAADHLGINQSIVATCYPTASALASSFNRELMEEIGRTLGHECQAEQIGILLGPGVNIKRSPLCGRNFEYFSEDPYLSGELAAAYIDGLQSKGIACSVKHFAVNNQETDRMSVNASVDERALQEIYFPAFEKAVKKSHAKTVMCSYNKVNGIFASENGYLLTEILREKWGHDGFVVSDWGAAKSMIKGIQSGMNLKMPGGNMEDSQNIIDAVNSKALGIEELDRSVRDILKVIEFVAEHRDEAAIYDREADHLIAKKAALESAVLLKNDGNILPLKRGKPIAVIGEFAKNPRYQGNGSSHVNAWRVDNAFDILHREMEVNYSVGEDIEEAKRIANGAEAAIIFAGLPDEYESEGFDRSHMDLPEKQNRLISEVAKVQKNTVVILHNGAAVTMPWVNEVPSILEMYLSGEAGGAAAAELLLGIAVPSGKLAETFPVKLTDNPSYLNFPGYEDTVEYREGIYVGYRYYDTKQMQVLFPFGHGLSYAVFTYGNLQLDKEEMEDTETLTVFVDITNTSKVAAKEVVQLYVRPEGMSIARPVHELKGFEKVSLMPGETKTVKFLLGKRDFALYHTGIKDWYVETGRYTIETGASSRDIRLKGSVQITGTSELPFAVTKDTPIGKILATAKGKEVLGKLLAGNHKKQKEGNELGKNTEEMKKRMMMQMPVGSLTTFGGVSQENLQKLVDTINGISPL